LLDRLESKNPASGSMTAIKYIGASFIFQKSYQRFPDDATGNLQNNGDVP
jgi:hypothetical protein